MSILFIIIKLLATMALVILFMVGASKAIPRTHNPENPAFVEYTVGFLFCAATITGFYYLWFG